MKKTLANSSLFKGLIASDKLKADLNKFRLNEDSIKPDDISSELSIIQRRFNYGNVDKIISMYMTSKVILLSNRDIDIPSYMSVVQVGTGPSSKILVIASRYVGSSSPIESPTKLFALLQNAFIQDQLDTNWDRYMNNIDLVTNTSIVYSRLSTKVLDKLYGLNLNTVTADFLSFIFAKFCLIAMCGKVDPELVNSIAYKSCFHGSSLKIILDKEELMLSEDPETYDTIFTLFTSLDNVIDNHKIAIRSYVENFVRMYGDQTILAIDHLPALYQMLFPVIINGNLNKGYIIENTVKVNLVKCYSAFMKLVK